MFHSDRLQKILTISNFFPRFQNSIINQEFDKNWEGWNLCSQKVAGLNQFHPQSQKLELSLVQHRNWLYH